MTNKMFPKVIGFRTCKPNGVSPSDDANGFIWPDTGPVTCQDWDPEAECGNGLHAVLVGQNNPGVWYEGKDAVYKVLEIDSDPKNLVDLDGKVKFRECNVLFSGNLLEASAYLAKYAPGGWYKVHNVGDHDSTNTGGNYSTNTGGNCSTNTGGHNSTNTGGNGSTNTGGNYSTNTGGNCSTNTGGYRSTNTGGSCSTNTGGIKSTNIGGLSSKCQGGENSTLSIKWTDVLTGRTRISTAYTGEKGIEAGVMYKLDGEGKFIKA